MFPPGSILHCRGKDVTDPADLSLHPTVSLELTVARLFLEKEEGWAVVVVAPACNPSTWEAEAGGFLSSRPAWTTE